jgi:hypothetical protein
MINTRKKRQFSNIGPKKTYEEKRAPGDIGECWPDAWCPLPNGANSIA